MKKIVLYIYIISVTAVIIFLSCNKEYSCEGCINGNKPPIAIAGPDQVITLPTDSISLDGSASNDPDGRINIWLWKKISGPATFNISTTSSVKTVVRNLDTGVYRFELKVTDDKNLSATDTVQITVNKQGQPANRLPIANAGADQTIIPPTNTITLNGSASTDPDNNIATYLWTKISGPSSFSISNGNAVQTQVTNLVQGVYQFELKVTDSGGLFSRDTMQVLNQPCVPNTVIQADCDNSMRPVVCAQLIPVGNLSLARDGIATVSAGNKLFFAGGYNASGPLSRVDIFDLTTNTWSIAELSSARARMSAVSSGNKVFFAGGGYSSDAATRVDIYDLATQTWSYAELSQGRYEMAVAAIGTKVFFAGGYQGAYYQTGPSSRIDIFDLATQTWSTTELSEPRSNITAVSTDNKVYFAGGYDGNNDGRPSDKIDIYNNSNDSWTISTFTEPKAFFAGVYKNGKMYWAGGTTYVNYGSGESWTCEVEIRDHNGQIIDSENLQRPSTYIGGFEKGNKILYLQGFGPYNTPAYFDIHDLTSNTWSIGLLNQQGLYNTACILSYNNIIYVAGGFLDNGGNGGFYTNQVWKLEF